MSDSNETTQPSTEPVRSTRAVLGLLAALLGIIVLLVAVVLVTSVDFNRGSGAGAQLVEGVNDDRFQAVSLSNGLTYFGKLEEGEGEWVVLKDAYYLRNATDGEASTKTPAADDSKYQVVPFADQVGGTGDMRINASDIQVVQDLKPSSPIVSYLEDSK